jgi:DNA polymerase-3 subunit beta
MKFSIDRDILLDNLNMISHGLPVKSPMPILTGIKLELTDSDLYLTSNNVDIAVEVLINDKSLEVFEPGKTVIPGKFFIDIIRKVNSKKINFSLVEERVLFITADKIEYKLNVMDYIDYPNIDFVPLENPLSLNASLIQSIIKQTVFATSSSEKKPILTGVNLKLEGKTLVCTATDSFRLSRKTINLDKEYDSFNITIPAKSLDELSKSLDQSEEDVSLYFSNNRLLFKFKNALFQTRLLEGDYPDTSKLIKDEYPMVIKFNKDELLDVVERVSLLSPHDRVTDKEITYSIIKLQVKENKVVELSTTNTLIGDAKEEIIPTELASSDLIKVGISSRYLVEALKSFKSTEVTINFIKEDRPFVVRSEKELDLVQLILPIRLD